MRGHECSRWATDVAGAWQVRDAKLQSGMICRGPPTGSR